MQQNEIIVQARPPRAWRVVPLEPSLRSRRVTLLIGLFLLVIIIAETFSFWESPFYATLWDSSYLSFSLYYIVYGLVYVLSASPWRALNKRRQQASRYNLATGLPGHAMQAYLSDLPTRFMIRLQRRWPATGIMGILCGLFLICMGKTLYTYWQASIQAVVHQGMPVILAFLQNGFNVAILLMLVWGTINYLVYTPRQKLIATPGGLLYQRGYRTNYIAWQEARLFAVIGRQYSKKRGRILYYELASADTVIRWPSRPRGRGEPWIDMPSAVSLLGGILAGPTSSAETFQQEVQLLNIIVNARSGLPLYDLC